MTAPDSDLIALDALQALVLAMPMARTLGLQFLRLERGRSELEIPVAQPFTFRPGQLQATPVFAIADFAAVSAAGTLLPAGWANASIDAQIKLFAAATGRALRSRGRVIDASRLLTVCAADVFTVDDKGDETPCATLLATARNIAPRSP